MKSEDIDKTFQSFKSSKSKISMRITSLFKVNDEKKDLESNGKV